MSKRQLAQIIDFQNIWRRAKDTPEMDIDNLSKEDADELFEDIDCGLSPENLHCDGEISHAQAMAKYRNYMGAVKELKRMGFKVPDTCYEIE
jgi:hypothetical protein